MDNQLFDINRILAQYTANVDETVDATLKEAATEAKKALAQSSPKDTGDYAKGWAVKKEKGNYIVYNKKAPGLTHLLEKGHDIVVNGQKVGHAPAKPHIKKVEEQLEANVMKKLEDKLKNVN